MKNPSIEKAIEYSIRHLREEIEKLELDLNIKKYIPLQRDILKKKLNRMKADYEEFSSISL